MAISSFLQLRNTILRFLGRPGDLLISNDIPDLIRLFESHADRVLKTRWQEAEAEILPVEGAKTAALPDDFRELRSIRTTSADPEINMRYLAPDQVTAAASTPSSGKYFTIEGLRLRLSDPAGAGTVITIGYMQGLTPLSGTVPTNWLLKNHPDAYLFGALTEAEMFLANDDRVAGWLKRRDMALSSIIASDAEARWGGGGIQMRPDWQMPGTV